jgi:hypothetical protein
MLSGLFLATMLAASSLAAAETPLTIDQLLTQGWEIAGYASGYVRGNSALAPLGNCVTGCLKSIALNTRFTPSRDCSRPGTTGETRIRNKRMVAAALRLAEHTL